MIVCYTLKQPRTVVVCSVINGRQVETYDTQQLQRLLGWLADCLLTRTLPVLSEVWCVLLQLMFCIIVFCCVNNLL